MVSNDPDARQVEIPPPGWFPMGTFENAVQQCHVMLDDEGNEKWEKAANANLHPLYQQGFMDGAEALLALVEPGSTTAEYLAEQARAAGFIA